MRLDPRRPRRRSGGFALIAALVLLVVLGTTGATMLRMTALQQAGSTGAILGARATLAAQSGVEWALHRVVALDDCPAAATALDLNEGVLTGFRVVVRCTATRHIEGSDERISVWIRAEASFGVLGTRDFVFREYQAAVVL